jgi:hypothetical protein
LRELLSPLPVPELASFQQHFDAVADAAYTWDVYGAAIQLNMESDEFFDFRCTLIAHGRRVYEAAVRDPDSFSKVHERDADEAFGLVASGLYEERVGDMLDRYDMQPLELVGEAWDVDDPEEHARRLPLR